VLDESTDDGHTVDGRVLVVIKFSMGVEPSRLSFARSIRLVARKEHTPLRIADGNSFLEDLFGRGSQPAPRTGRLIGLAAGRLDVVAGPQARSVMARRFGLRRIRVRDILGGTPEALGRVRIVWNAKAR